MTDDLSGPLSPLTAGAGRRWRLLPMNQYCESRLLVMLMRRIACTGRAILPSVFENKIRSIRIVRLRKAFNEVLTQLENSL